MSPVIAVCGATGTQGGAVVRHLSNVGEFEIRALTRNPSSPSAQKLTLLPNVHAIEFNMSSRESIESAFKGAEAVFAMTNFYDSKVQEEVWEEAREGKLMADVAKEVGVKVFIWSTVPSAYKRTEGEVFTRLVENKTVVTDHLKKIGIPHIVLNLGFFFDNYLNFMCTQVEKGGTIRVHLPILFGDTKFGMIYIERDLGPIINALLNNYKTDSRILGGEIYGVCGLHSVNDYVNALEKKFKRPVHHVIDESSGLKDLDDMYRYYNKWGLYQENTIPQPLLLELGIKFSTIDNFVDDCVVPYIDSLGATEGTVNGI